MAEEAVRRKSRLLLNNLAPVTNTYDELVRSKLEAGQFTTTVTGVIKVIGMLVLLFSLAFFLAQPLCENTADWYPYLFPASVLTTLGVQLTMYIIFSLGGTVRRPGIWIYLDIGLILTLSVVTITCSVITFKECIQGGSQNEIPGPCAMAGAIILIISCGSIFLLYRFVEEEDLTPAKTRTDATDDDKQKYVPRKSIFA
ncbi:hypothetical protein JTB14_022493 [Gonioctena quinquepunctata]|nr:hypothetical protein JTB14_022493 [Gonioctena quinquepunctata]